jgi:long-chain fatty acid transport protein
MGLAGADVAWAEGPISALGINPAGLGMAKDPNLELSFTTAIADGRYEARSGERSKLRSDLGLLPEGGLAYPVGKGVTLGLGIIADSALRAKWNYTDPPGGAAGATYGQQEHLSEILVLRSALGMSVDLGSKLTLGASFGLLYNDNTLQAPYIFQSQPALKGLKTLLDLNTDGLGYSGNFGLIFKATEELRFGLAYHTGATIHSEGTATGNASTQLNALGAPFNTVRSDFSYDAEVDNKFPQMVNGGVSWQAHKQLRVAAQVDWIDWSSSFDTLHVRLKNGDNGAINGVVGNDWADDYVPLDWKDSFVYRLGLEFAASDNLTLRTGYSYGSSPVPGSTLTPMTAAITEHTFAAGAGYTWGRYHFDLAYQYDLPASQSVGTSKLQAGEYSGTRVDLGLHWIALSASVRF